MTRHDPSARTVAIRHRPIGSAALIIAATVAMPHDPMKIVATGAQTRPDRPLQSAPTKPWITGSARHSTAPKRKYP